MTNQDDSSAPQLVPDSGQKDDRNENRIPDSLDPADINSPAQQIVDESDAIKALEERAGVAEIVPADAEVHDDVDVVRNLNEQNEQEGKE